MVGADISVLDTYNLFISNFPPLWQSFANFILLVAMVSAYSILIWKFYTLIAKKNLLEFNLPSYIKSNENSFSTKLLAGALYFVEYILITPFLIFATFALFTLVLIVLSQNENVSQILTISAIITATIRVTSYYKKNLSQEIAKILPFTLLLIYITNPNFLLDAGYIERIANQIMQISPSLGQAGYYLLFIVLIEISLRFFDFVPSLFGKEKDNKKEEKKIKKN